MLTARPAVAAPLARTVAPLRWTLWLDEVPRPGWSNMALDAALLDLAIGREAIAARQLDTVGRPTGGRAVWHAAELSYAIAAPAAAFGDLARAYRLIHAMLQRALRSRGVAAWLAPDPAGPAALNSGACFASPAGGEVVTEGGKLVGSAQLRHNGALLQHGSLLLDGDQQMVRAVTRGDTG